ncbi:hypothetical protein [Legionella tunisiensis]|uniref:hypothetical protein n=1 Tax=Legionella tunisiensis TaxID=1034944 RepID=UPI0003156BAA|nr:hypothetical protein [Legionella tunisiensis]
MISEQPMAQLLAEDQALLRLNKITRIICETTNPEACNVKWDDVERASLRFNFDTGMDGVSSIAVQGLFPNIPRDIQGDHSVAVKLDTANTVNSFLNRFLQREVETILIGQQNFSYSTKFGLPHPKTGCGATGIAALAKTKRLFHERTMQPYAIKLIVGESNQLQIIVDAPGEPTMVAKTLCDILGFAVNEVVVTERSLLFFLLIRL